MRHLIAPNVADCSLLGGLVLSKSSCKTCHVVILSVYLQRLIVVLPKQCFLQFAFRVCRLRLEAFLERKLFPNGISLGRRLMLNIQKQITNHVSRILGDQGCTDSGPSISCALSAGMSQTQKFLRQRSGFVSS